MCREVSVARLVVDAQAAVGVAKHVRVNGEGELGRHADPLSPPLAVGKRSLRPLALRFDA